MEKAYIGVDIGGMSIKAGIVDLNGKIVKKEVLKTNTKNGAGQFLKDINSIIVALLEFANKNNYDIHGIGFGVPGIVNNDLGTIDYSCNLNLSNVPLKDYLKDLNLPIFVSNDANVATLAEQRWGAARGYKDVILITLGTGIGGGVIINNKLFEGFEGKGAELGHHVIVVDGAKCGCGRNGCFETYASASALLRYTKEYMQKDKKSLMWEYANNNIDNVDGLTCFECAKKGDKTANKVVDLYIKYLGEGLLNFSNIFRPQAIVLGGGISNQNEYLKDKVMKYMEDRNYGLKNTPKVEILIAKFKNDAGIIGAATLAFINN